MSREEVEPTVTQKPNGETTFNHAAFGQVRASRVSGYSTLYGSDFLHHNYIVITIARSELNRHLAKDWHFAREELIEVALSEGQWSTFVSAMNVGGGVPCTIQHVDRKRMPDIPYRKQETEFRNEVKADIKSAVDNLEKLRMKIEDALGPVPKGKRNALLGEIDLSIRALSDSLPFVADSFDNHMEKSTERAKAEIHGYMTGAIQRAGIAALQSEPPLLLEQKPQDNKDA